MYLSKYLNTEIRKLKYEDKKQYVLKDSVAASSASLHQENMDGIETWTACMAGDDFKIHKVRKEEPLQEEDSI